MGRGVGDNDCNNDPQGCISHHTPQHSFRIPLLHRLHGRDGLGPLRRPVWEDLKRASGTLGRWNVSGDDSRVTTAGRIRSRPGRSELIPALRASAFLSVDDSGAVGAAAPQRPPRALPSAEAAPLPQPPPAPPTPLPQRPPSRVPRARRIPASGKPARGGPPPQGPSASPDSRVDNSDRTRILARPVSDTGIRLGYWHGPVADTDRASIRVGHGL